MRFLTRTATCLGTILLLAGAATGASAQSPGQRSGMTDCPMMGMGPGMMGGQGMGPGMMGPGMMMGPGQGMGWQQGWGSGMMGPGMGPGWQQGQGPGMMAPGMMDQGMMGPGTISPGAGGGPMMGPSQGMGQGMGPGPQLGMARSPYAMPVDQNRDGMVTAEEAALWHEMIFAALDIDENDALSLEEFAAGHMGSGARAGGRQERREARFRELDRNGDGQVTLEEFLDTAATRFQAADRDGDGQVSVWEFRSSSRG